MAPPYQISDWYGGRPTCHTASGATAPACLLCKSYQFIIVYLVQHETVGDFVSSTKKQQFKLYTTTFVCEVCKLTKVTKNWRTTLVGWRGLCHVDCSSQVVVLYQARLYVKTYQHWASIHENDRNLMKIHKTCIASWQHKAQCHHNDVVVLFSQYSRTFIKIQRLAAVSCQ